MPSKALRACNSTALLMAPASGDALSSWKRRAKNRTDAEAGLIEFRRCGLPNPRPAIDRAHETLVAAKREKRDLFAEQRGLGRGANFDALFAKWLERHAKVHKKSWEADEALYNRHVKERLGSIGANDLKRGDIINFLNDVADEVSGIQANRCQSLVSGVMNWAVSEDLLDVSPTHGITKRGAETVRQRVLSDAELKTFWGALRPTRIDDAVGCCCCSGKGGKKSVTRTSRSYP